MNKTKEKKKYSHPILYISASIILLAVIFIALIIISHNPKTSTPINVLVASDCPPFAFAKADSLQGLEVELLKLLQDKLRQDLTLTPINSNILLKTLYDGDYQMAVGAITPTYSRKEFFDFSPSYYDASQTILSLTDTSLDSLTAIAPAKIGVINLSSSVFYIEENLIRTQLLPVNNLKKYPDLASLIDALQQEEVQYIMVEQTIATLLQTNYGLNIAYQTEQSETFCLVLKKSAKVNKTISTALIRIIDSEQYNDLIANRFHP